MLVVDKTSKPLETFDDLKFGDVFYNYEGMLCIKVNENMFLKYFESDGTWFHDYVADRYESVTRVNATLVLED